MQLTYSKVDRSDTIHDDEDVGVCELGKAIVQSDWEEEHEQLQIKVEGGPGGGLMLRNRGDDGDVVLGVGGVKQGVETTSPGSNLAQGCSDASSSQDNRANKKNEGFEQQVEVVLKVKEKKKRDNDIVFYYI